MFDFTAKARLCVSLGLFVASLTTISTAVHAEDGFGLDPFKLAVPDLAPDPTDSARKDAMLAERLMRENDAMALDALKQEFAGETFHLPALVRPSGLMYFQVVSVTAPEGIDPAGFDSADTGNRSATYIAQHADETFECGEIAWVQTEGAQQVRRHDRHFFSPSLLRDADARASLQQMGCL